MRILLFIIALGAVIVFCAAALADSAEEQARVLFEQGKSLFEQEKYAEAAEAFNKANKLKPSWKLFYNIGQSEAAAKRYGLALQAFERYLAEGGDELPEERRDEVLAEVVRFRKMVGYLEIRAPNGYFVIIDEVSSGQTPLDGPLVVTAAVEHRVRVKKVNETILDRKIQISGGQSMVIEAQAPDKAGKEPGPAAMEKPVVSEKAPAMEPKPAVGPEEEGKVEGSGMRIWGWIGVGLGGALLAGGGITGGTALSIGGDLEESCPNGECPPDEYDNMDRMNNLSVMSTAFFIGGGAAAVAGAVLLIVDAKKNKEVNLAVSPVGVVLAGRF